MILKSLFLICTIVFWFMAYIIYERWSRVPSEDYSLVHPDNVEFVRAGVEKYKKYSKKMRKISWIYVISGILTLFGFFL